MHKHHSLIVIPSHLDRLKYKELNCSLNYRRLKYKKSPLTLVTCKKKPFEF